MIRIIMVRTQLSETNKDTYEKGVKSSIIDQNYSFLAILQQFHKTQ